MPTDLLTRYHWRAPVYDLELLPFEPLRHACIGALQLQPGERVLDLGCGTGLSLPLLQQQVGPRGWVLGLEQCPAMLARAQARVDAAGWRQVQLQCAPVARMHSAPQAKADAALFMFTHDILQDEAALLRVLAALAPGARVAAAGLCLATAASPWALPVNALVLGAALYSVASLQALDRPWGLLERLCGSRLELRTPAGFFIASGRISSGHNGQE